MNKHPISSYNKYISLKANGLMIMISLYLIKPIIVTAASAIYKGRQSPLDIFYPDRFNASLEAAAAIPILLLIFAWSRRSPGASNLIKLLCKNGKLLILTTASIQLIIVSSPFWLLNNGVLPRIVWIQIILYFWVILLTFFSTYMKDCFADFPENKQD